MRFFDASALVKRYVRERGSGRVRALLGSGATAVSRLSEVEVASAFARLARERAISASQRDRATSAFIVDLAAWHTVELTPVVAGTARLLLRKHSLRAGDAIQLAGALVLQQGLGEPIEMFVAADQRLTQAAAEEGLPLVDLLT